MFFDIHILEKRKIHFDEVLSPGKIDLLDEQVKQLGDLRATGVAELLGSGPAAEIHIQGSLQAKVEVACARCLEAAEVNIAGPMDLYYRPMSQIAKAEEVSLKKAETEVGFFEGEGVSLADAVREQILTQLPMQTLCREACRGICPVCGVNRNREECRCHETFADPRWERLRKWKP